MHFAFSVNDFLYQAKQETHGYQSQVV